MLAILQEATRTYGTHYMAKILELSPGEVYDRQEGYREWTVRDAAALSIYCGTPLSVLAN